MTINSIKSRKVNKTQMQIFFKHVCTFAYDKAKLIMHELY